MSRRKISTTVYLDHRALERLEALSKRTGVPMAEYIRRGVEAVLSREESIPDLTVVMPQAEGRAR